MGIEEWKKALGQGWLREELETAWLRGYRAGIIAVDVGNSANQRDREQEAADYAERVVGGSTRPGKPEASRPLGEQSSPQRPERPGIG